MPTDESPAGEELPDELREHIAVLEEEPPHETEAAIALLSDQGLSLLIDAGVIAPNERSGEDVQEIRLSPSGRLIAAAGARAREGKAGRAAKQPARPRPG